MLNHDSAVVPSSINKHLGVWASRLVGSCMTDVQGGLMYMQHLSDGDRNMGQADLEANSRLGVINALRKRLGQGQRTASQELLQVSGVSGGSV